MTCVQTLLVNKNKDIRCREHYTINGVKYKRWKGLTRGNFWVQTLYYLIYGDIVVANKAEITYFLHHYQLSVIKLSTLTSKNFWERDRHWQKDRNIQRDRQTYSAHRERGGRERRLENYVFKNLTKYKDLLPPKL